jgi:hypothetical protein
LGIRDYDLFEFLNPLSEPGIARIASSVRLLKKLTVLAIKSRPPKATNSAVEMLTASLLPYIFERNFEVKFGIGTQGARGTDGPGVRFVLACLDASGIKQASGEKYSAETIRTYWQNRRKGKMRRREPDKASKKI